VVCDGSPRILIVGDASSIALEQWVIEMQARGHEVRVMSPVPAREALAGVTVGTEAGPRIPLVRFVARILRIRSEITLFRPDVVHGHGALDYALWAVLSGFRPVLITAWGSDVLLGPSQSARSGFKVRFALRRATYVTATSRHLLEQAEKSAGRPLAGEVLHWGVDLDTFHSPDTRDERPVTILSVRQHTPLYNIDVILRAFARVHAAAAPVRLALAGSGPETESLKALATELGIADAVDFLGWVDQSDLPDLYRRSDIYVSVPSSDASAVSNMEAMASGLPLVLSDLPSAREWVRGDVEGELVPAGDADALARSLERLATDSGLRTMLGSNARDRVEQLGPRKGQMDRASDLYCELAEVARS
jgi:glycosyltransferase involved in cell wall biosynthesis